MKIQIALPLAALMFCACNSARAIELPVQKPGLWAQTMTGADIPGGTRSYSLCQDAASIAAAKASSDAHLKNDCSKHDLSRIGDTWTANVECTFSGIHIVSHSVTTFHGDDSYHTQITSSTSSSGHAKPASVMTIDNKWMGACKPGQKVGVPAAIK